MPVVLALAAAALYGVSDYVGGRASRTVRPLVITMLAEVAGLVALAAVLPVLGDPVPVASDLLWGALAGVAGLVGVTALYWSLANGAMTVVAPVTGVFAAGIPVAVGLATGERPGLIATAGMLVGLCSIALVAGVVGIAHVRTPGRILATAMTAGTGFGLLFVFLAQTSNESGLWPLVVARIVAAPILVLAVFVRGDMTTIGRRDVAVAAGVGAMLLAANVAYLVAVREGLLSVVAVVVSLSPAATVWLATVFDRERMNRSQYIGLVLAGVALVLVALRT